MRTLIPKVERLIHNNGTEAMLLVLGGTVAINYQGRQYNIPVEVYVSEPYPDAPPRCYVRPTKDMDIKVGHRHVDRDGLVYLPYLHEWNPRSHNLTELCAAMSSVFGMDPPVYAVRKGSPPRQPTYPTAGAMGYPGQQAGGGGSGRYPSPGMQQQPPPPAYESVAGGGSGVSMTPGNQQAQAEARRREAVQQVLSKTQRSLLEFYGKVTAELTEEQDKEAKLQGNRREVVASVARLKTMKEQVEERIKLLTEKDAALDKWVATQADKPEVHVDQLVEANDPPSRQMLELVATNAAIEDALYHLDKALANSSVDLLTFLKKVRELSREQFMAVAHVNKIYRAQQAALVASRAASAAAPPPGQGAPGGGTFSGPVSYPVLPPSASR